MPAKVQRYKTVSLFQGSTPQASPMNAAGKFHYVNKKQMQKNAVSVHSIRTF